MVMDRVSHKTKIDVFENAFRKIKEVSELLQEHSKPLLREGGGGGGIKHIIYFIAATLHLAVAAAGYCSGGQCIGTLNTPSVASATFEKVLSIRVAAIRTSCRSARLALQATGVSDVNEVIQKMVSQESTAESLMILTKENQVRRRKHNKHSMFFST